ncbi:Protein translocase complex SecE/Sec61-gamma subunit protein [Dioscorea alata]|uniref:Protein translocase complex SecE/Sec61-gamma subunit protein n=4 Tax=Dioscorea alata TaxID=55571 RepID=A0ACB7VYN4_DIOAL|nr:Protein translocase complex SecE/Sec61-gamma subunit protein [Dioscorea alata]KAH7679852.1 Protein translocase complex SecE/Sec61-gamma subunit protein [Dioscorea alata]KAH7679857.1 Protein translocase complex SecE/Sec61-gamma subunit protein [Dioscorea alata]KAH7679858.1 Protein translocase complex SecE/Sec61-gamma subunit protein [Dioscorea alata]
MTTTWMHCSDSSLFTWYKSPGTMGKSMKAQVLFVNRTSPRSCFGFWKFSKKRQFMLEEASEKFSGNIFPAPKHLRYAANGGNGYRNLTTKDQFNDEPFWLSLMRDVIWSVRYLVDFLVEQPSQLKYIEWPQFQTTLKTAALTLVLVAILIVALATIDSGLCYILAFFLSRPA